MAQITQETSGNPAPAGLPRFFTVFDIAAALGVEPDTVRKWESNGELRATRIGRLVRFTAADVETFIRNRVGDA